MAEQPAPAAAPAPSAAPAAHAPPPPRKVVALRPQKSFPAAASASAADRLKEYLKDVPMLHGRLTKAVTEQEANAAASRKTLADFETTVAQMKGLVAKWEQEEQSHVGPRVAEHAPAAPAPVADPGAGTAAAVEAPAAPAGESVGKNAC